jgi:hypothetical protein
MGKRSDELQREIREYRQRLDEKADRLSERVRSDVRDSRETVDKDLRERLQLEKYADERPLLTLAAAFGTGVLLGSCTPSAPTPSMPSMPGRDGGSSRRDSADSGGGGMLASLIGSASGALSGTIEEEVREIFSQVTRGRGNEEQRSNGERVHRHVEREHDAEAPETDIGAGRYGP